MSNIYIYFIAFLTCCMFAQAYQNRLDIAPTGHRRADFYCIYLMSFLPLAVLAGLRYNVGGDYDTYEYWFSKVIETNRGIFDPIYNTELFYYVLMYLFAKISRSYQFFLFAQQIIILGGVFCFFKEIHRRYDASIPVMMLVYCCILFSMTFNVARQAIAVAIVMFSQKYVFERKPFKYIFLIIVAGLFHQSALLCIVFYFLKFDYTESEQGKRILVYVGIIAGALLGASVILFFQTKFGLYTNYEQQETYLNIYNYLITEAPLILLCLVYKDTIIQNDAGYFLNIYLLKIAIVIATSQWHWGFRMGYYMYFSEMALTAIIIKKIQRKADAKIVTCIYSLYFIILFLYNTIVQSADGLLPYITIFSK